MTRTTSGSAEVLPSRVCVADLSVLLTEQAKNSVLPLVSVIIPTHNSADYFQDTFLSVVNQRYRPIEVIIVDDHSTDETHTLIHELRTKHDEAEFQVRFFENGKGGRQLGGILVLGMQSEIFCNFSTMMICSILINFWCRSVRRASMAPILSLAEIGDSQQRRKSQRL